MGTGVVYLVATGRPARSSASRPAGGHRLLPWLVVAAVFTAVEMSALLTGQRPEFPTVSALLGPLFVETGPRVLGYFAWLTTGYWLLQR